jgi:hypothetical protein
MESKPMNYDEGAPSSYLEMSIKQENEEYDSYEDVRIKEEPMDCDVKVNNYLY